VVPAVSGHSSAVLEYKNALAKYFPGEAPDYASLEGFVAANILIDALKRTGAQLDTEKLVDALESTRSLDLGLGVPLLGMVVALRGYAAAFQAGCLAALLAAAVGVTLVVSVERSAA
jgi:hypothetical protein